MGLVLRHPKLFDRCRNWGWEEIKDPHGIMCFRDRRLATDAEQALNERMAEHEMRSLDDDEL